MADCDNIDSTEWRSIPEFSNYEVSEYGDVRRVAPACGATVGMVLTPKWHIAGYPRYNLRQGGRAHGREAHRLVAAAFLGDRPPRKTEIAHIDGNPTNNHWSNLRYSTRRENERDKILHGTNPRGARNGQAKVTEADVREMRAAYAAGGTTYSALAPKFGITYQAVAKIITRARWSHV